MHRYQGKSSLQRELATQEYHRKKANVKGLMLVEGERISQRQAAYLVEVPRTTIDRANRAREDNR
jgi:hypothetical protein